MTLPINSLTSPRSRDRIALTVHRFMSDGQSENLPITKQERAHGSPTIVIAHRRPASHQPMAITKPPSTTHKMLSRELIMPSQSRLLGHVGSV